MTGRCPFAVLAVTLSLSFSLAPVSAQDADAKCVELAPFAPIDFAKVDRTIKSPPKLESLRPLYGLFLFGRNGEHRVWAIFDRQKQTKEGVYDVLYIDRNADGDLRDPDERVVASPSGKRRGLAGSVKFHIGKFKEPGSKVVHEDFEVTYTKPSVRYKMRWRGEKVTMGCFGPKRDTYQQFAASPKEAPVFVPGYDRPFEFEHWMSGTLRRGRDTSFKVFVGNKGDRRGAFSCVDQDFLPKGAHVLATLLYTDTNGKQREYQAKLTARC